MTFYGLLAFTAVYALQIAAIICVLVPLILGAYALAATRARQLFTSQRARRRLNRSTGAAMAGAAVVVAVR